MKSNFKHNKRRDTGLLYELLVRKLGHAMVENNQEIYKKTLSIVREYFGDGAPLSAERELFDVIKNARGVSEQIARKILAEVQRHAKLIDSKKLDIKKSNLIKEVNHSLGREFFSEYRIPEYRLLASIQMMLDAARTQDRITETVQKIQLEEGLVKHMMSKGQNAIPERRSDVDVLVMNMVAKRFDERYSGVLIPAQKKLLEKYLRAQVTGDERPLREFIITESNRGMLAIETAKELKDVKNDVEMTRRLDEAYSKLKGMLVYAPTKNNTDVIVEELMLFQRLASEIEGE